MSLETDFRKAQAKADAVADKVGAAGNGIVAKLKANPGKVALVMAAIVAVSIAFSYAAG